MGNIVVTNKLALIFIGVSVFSCAYMKKFGACYVECHRYNEQVGSDQKVSVLESSFTNFVTNFIFHNNLPINEEVTYIIRTMKCKCGKHITEYKDGENWRKWKDFDVVKKKYMDNNETNINYNQKCIKLGLTPEYFKKLEDSDFFGYYNSQ